MQDQRVVMTCVL